MSNVNSWWERRRRMRVDEASKQLLGNENAREAGADDLAAQQFEVGMFVRRVYDAGFDRIALIQNLLVAACYVGDNHGVSREQMAKVVMAVEMKADRKLIYTPNE